VGQFIQRSGKESVPPRGSEWVRSFSLTVMAMLHDNWLRTHPLPWTVLTVRHV
jgi:hypothetical protein